MKTTDDTMAPEPHYQAPPVDDADFTQLCNALLAMEDDDGADFNPLGLVGAEDGLAAQLSGPAAVNPKVDLTARSEAHPMPLAPPAADAGSPQPSLSVDSDVCFAALLDDGTPEVDPFRWPDGAEWLGVSPIGPSQSQPSSEPLSPSPPATDAPPATTFAASRAASPAESAGEANLAPASKRTKRARAPEAASEGGDSSGVSETRALLGFDPSASLAEQRRQKRMAKNRRTAAESRERKKAAAAEAAREAAELREENTRLKAALERAEARSRALEGQLASLARGAGAESPAESPAPATTTTTTTTAAAVEHMEPAEPQPNTAVSQLRTTTTDVITLPPVMPQPQLAWSSASPSSSSPELFTAWLLLSCVAMTCHAANSTLEALAQVVIQALRQHAGLPALLLPATDDDSDEAGSGPTSSHQRVTLDEPSGRPSRAPDIDTETAKTRQLETSDESLAETLAPPILPAAAAISDRQLRALLQQCSSALLSRAPSAAPPLAPLVC